MGSIVQKIADEIALHGSYEAYCTWRDQQDEDMPFVADLEVSNGRKIEGFYFDEFAAVPRIVPGG